MDQAEGLRAIIKASKPSSKALDRVIAVTSGKGGVGKSNTAINLAIQLKKLGQRVIILDADFGLANIEIMFGTVPKHNLCDLIYQGKSIQEIITRGAGNVDFISGGSGIVDLANLSRQHLIYIIQNLAQLDTMADVIIIDTGAGIADAVIEFLVASDEIILVTTPEPTSITDSYSLLKVLHQHTRFSVEECRIKVLTNRVENQEEGQNLFDKLNVVVGRYLELPLTYVGAIPQDNRLAEAVMRQTPVSLWAPEAKSARAYERLAARLMDKEEQTEMKKKGMAAFFSQLLSGKK